MESLPLWSLPPRPQYEGPRWKVQGSKPVGSRTAGRKETGKIGEERRHRNPPEPRQIPRRHYLGLASETVSPLSPVSVSVCLFRLGFSFPLAPPSPLIVSGKHPVSATARFGVKRYILPRYLKASKRRGGG